jgi:hypothetical protein
LCIEIIEKDQKIAEIRGKRRQGEKEKEQTACKQSTEEYESESGCEQDDRSNVKCEKEH